MKNDAAYHHGYDNARRNADGTVVHDDLIELVATAIDFDERKERLGRARRIVASRMRPGGTAPEGAVVLNGMEPYAYEPHRLLVDDAGNVVENKDAPVRFKVVEAERAEDAAERAEVRAGRERGEADHFSAWVERETAGGRDPQELTWDTCVRETGLWKDADPEPEEPVEDDD